MEFKKYKDRGADYHWRQISKNLRTRNAYVLGRYQNMVKLLSQNLSKSKDIQVLDLGCGDGVLSFFIKKAGYSVTGIDYSEEAINAAKEKPVNSQITFKVGSAYDLPFSDKSFDAIVSSEVIEHLEDVELYLNEIKRCTKDNGLIIISTPIRITKEPLDPNHVQEWFKEDFEDFMRSRFTNINFKYSHPVYLQEINTLPLLGRAIPKFMINAISLLKNPFVGFPKKAKYNTLQYAIIIN